MDQKKTTAHSLRDEAGQTTAFFAKLILVVAVIGFPVIDLGGPFITRIQVDHDVNEAIIDASKTYVTSLGNVDAARTRLETDLTPKGITVTNVELIRAEGRAASPWAGTLRVTVQKDAKTYLMGRMSQLRDWYTVQVVAETEVK